MTKPYRNLTLMILLAVLLAACANTPAATTSAPPTLAATSTLAATNTPAPTNTPAATATPEATATTAPTATTAAMSGGDCLVGSWKFANIADYFASIMSQGQSPATFTGSEGDIIYTFRNDGTASIDAQDFVAKFEITAESLTLPLEVSMTGTAGVNYTASSANQITFSDIQSDDLKFSASMGGQELFSSTPAELSAAFGVSDDPQYNTFTYECTATTLKYTPPVPGAQPITLERVP